MTTDAIIKLENVWKVYQMGEVEVNALKGVSVEIQRGDFVAIIGASGSGKTTMMNLVGCLDLPTKGIIYLENKNISKMSESKLASLRGITIGFIFQQYNLLPNMSAFDNVLLPLELQEVPDSKARKKVAETLKMVGLEDKGHHKPTQLSGGQQQRVSIARSLVSNPDIILADEPTGALDSITGREVIETLYRLWKHEDKTVILVTHDLNLAQYANTLIELKDGNVHSIKKNKNQKIPENGKENRTGKETKKTNTAKISKTNISKTKVSKTKISTKNKLNKSKIKIRT